jgi:hypothetical protein
VLEFPHDLLRETVTERPRLVGAVRTGGRTASGVVTASRADGGGLWAYGLQSIVINKSYLVRRFEMFLALLAEGARPIIVPICNHNYAPIPEDDPAAIDHIDVPHSPDDTPFSDDALYHQHYSVDANISAAAPLRATTITLHVLMSGPFVGGELFSIEHPNMGWRFYRVVGITETATPGYYSVQIEPPLREAINAGTAADFNEPRCVMQLAAPASLELQMRRFGRPTLQFIESFMPLA